MATDDLFTSGQIFNGIGNIIEYKGEHKDWFGGTINVPCPPKVGTGERHLFLHLNAFKPPIGSSGGVVYGGMNDKGGEIQWIVAWDNRADVTENLVYTKVRAPAKVDWDVIEQKLPLNQNSSSYDGCFTHVSITDGNFPEIRAVLTPKSKSKN
ncbi:23 kDa jasmonate-induced protein-like [Ziziphus jujuba]|uniref:23 kDa jasmonate-induced protein-like n=1 Tax=Ziziphus jujuba TaxID=326968 RepID=A0ABM4ADN6_ZIZJJ|nr:23 kDa jasmonate-induced protein-like [Ziziphus jujuba]